jgi:hypothetical protein
MMKFLAVSGAILKMTATGELQTISAIEGQSLTSLTGMLEFAILSVLIHYNGSYEETLVDWYAALRLGLPQLAHPKEVRDVFKRLAGGRIVELHKDDSGSYSGRDADDDRFFSGGSFTTALTAQGLVYWNTVRIHPGQSCSF